MSKVEWGPKPKRLGSRDHRVLEFANVKSMERQVKDGMCRVTVVKFSSAKGVDNVFLLCSVEEQPESVRSTFEAVYREMKDVKWERAVTKKLFVPEVKLDSAEKVKFLSVDGLLDDGKGNDSEGGTIIPYKGMMGYDDEIHASGQFLIVIENGNTTELWHYLDSSKVGGMARERRRDPFAGVVAQEDLPLWKYFVEIDAWYMDDPVNSKFFHAKSGYKTMLEKFHRRTNRTTQRTYGDVGEKVREHYGMMHAKYLLTPPGQARMLTKYLNDSFQPCPLDKCAGTRCLPYGLADQVDKHGVKFYCPSCAQIYEPSDPEDAKIDGAFFGPSYVHLLVQQYREIALKPDKKVDWVRDSDKE